MARIRCMNGPAARAGAWGLAAMLAAGLAPAATITVDTSNDGFSSSRCSLRSAIQAANTNTAQQACPAGSPSAIDTIVVPPGVYTMSSQGTYWDEAANQTGDFDIAGSVVVHGTDARSTVIVAPPRDRVFDVHNAATPYDVTIENLTLLGGDVTANSYNNGGTLLSTNAILKLRKLVVRDGRALYGGNMTIIAEPGAIATLDGVSVLDGTAQNGSGGGIYVDDGNTTIAQASQFNNVTLSGNSGYGLRSNGSLKLVNATITGNHGGGIYVPQTPGGRVWIANSIVAGNVGYDARPNDLYCAGSSGTYGAAFYSLIGSKDAGCSAQGEVGVIDGDPRLSPAFDFGAGIPVHALLPGSPAIGAGKPEQNNASTDCRVLDARGVSRPGTHCDLGAYQVRYDVVVNSTADLADASPGDGVCATISNTCTLRAVTMEASASGGRWMVQLPAGTYALNLPMNFSDGPGGDLDVRPVAGRPALSLALFGPGGADAVQVVGGDDRVLEIRGKDVWSWGEPDDYHAVAFALLGATLRDGHLTHDPFQYTEEDCCAFGGGVRIRSARVLFEDVVVRDNTVAPGAGVYGYGGGIDVELAPQYVAEPEGTSSFLPYSTGLRMERFAVVGNTVLGDGGAYGGLFVSSYVPQTTFPTEPLLLRNGSVSGNTAYDVGGLIASGNGNADVQLSYLTVTGNQSTSADAAAIDGLRLQGAAISNSILAGNVGIGHARDCRVDAGATVLGLGYVVVGNSAAECAIAGDTTGNLYDTDARLGPLEVFAGGMQGHRLLVDSPALDLVPPDACIDTRGNPTPVDARGVARPGDDATPGSAYCTPGAIEGDALDAIFADGLE